MTEVTRDWGSLLSHLTSMPLVRGLEIGSSEGRSSCWIVDNILTGPGATLNCVDSWGSGEPPVEARFDHNTAERSPISKHRSPPFDWLTARNTDRATGQYDFVFLHGDRCTEEAFSDLTLCWSLLCPGGILICDTSLFPHEDLPSKVAMDAFFASRSDWRPIHKGSPSIVRKSVGVQAVVVSVDYADYLSHTLPMLVRRVDRVAVVSTPEDEQTAEVVRQIPFAELVVTDEFTRRGDRFNKGAAINVGLRQIDRTGWVLLTDADIALTGSIPIPSDKSALWGVARRRAVGYSQFQKALVDDSGVLPVIKKWRLRDGCYPLGYFQLWHWPTSPQWMPESSDDASSSDVEFARRWPRQRRRLIRDYQVLHLETGDVTSSANWRGRITDRFESETERDMGSVNKSVDRGILTAANSRYWPVLRLLVQATQQMKQSLCVVDHGLTERQRQWLGQEGVRLLDIPVPPQCRTLMSRGQRIQPTSAKEAWLKPWLCMNSPYQQTIWIDADAVPIRGLQRMFRLLDRGPWLTLESWVTDRSAREMYEPLILAAYGHLPRRFENAHRLNTGVFGFRRDDNWIGRWWDTCSKILSTEDLFAHSRLRDQAALVTYLCAADCDTAPRIQLDRGLNWPANGVRAGNRNQRKRYRWRDPDLLTQLRRDHPAASVVHWLGNPKPWQMN